MNSEQSNNTNEPYSVLNEITNSEGNRKEEDGNNINDKEATKNNTANKKHNSDKNVKDKFSNYLDQDDKEKHQEDILEGYEKSSGSIHLNFQKSTGMYSLADPDTTNMDGIEDEAEPDLDFFENNTFLKEGELFFPAVHNQIKEFEQAILQRDDIIKELSKSLECMLKEKEKGDENTKKFAVKVEILQNELDKYIEKNDKTPNFSAFDETSYFSPSKALDKHSTFNDSDTSNCPFDNSKKTENVEVSCQTTENVFISNNEASTSTTNLHNYNSIGIETDSQPEPIKKSISTSTVLIKLASVECSTDNPVHVSTSTITELPKEIVKKSVETSTDIILKNSIGISTLIKDEKKSIATFTDSDYFEVEKSSIGISTELPFVIEKHDNETSIEEGEILDKSDSLDIASLTAHYNNEISSLKLQIVDLMRELDFEKSCLDKEVEERYNEKNLLQIKIEEINEEKKQIKKEKDQLDDILIEKVLKIKNDESCQTEYFVVKSDMAVSTNILSKDVEKIMNDMGESSSVECIEDGEIHEKSGSSEKLNTHNSEVDDLKLRVTDLSKKLESERKYLEEQTVERENERDEFQKKLYEILDKLEESKNEKEKLMVIINHQKNELEENEAKLKDALDFEQELILKSDKAEYELKNHIEKICELREIIRDLEGQIDSATENFISLKDQNKILTEELDRQIKMQNEQYEAINNTQDTICTHATDITEELQAQVQDLATRLEKKLIEMENFHWSPRPSSSCSGNISVSTEDISFQHLKVNNANQEKDCITLFSESLRRLDTHFESLIRFEDVIMKKLCDTEMRLSSAKKRLEETESERTIYQDRIQQQITKIADLESRLDNFRFEPAPNNVTLSGLRGRVNNLTEELEEFKGELHLKKIELKDLTNKYEANKVILKKYTDAAKVASIIPTKSSTTTFVQTERKHFSNSFMQTDTTKFEKNKLTKDSSAQTQIKEKNFNFENWDISDITSGGPTPKHSTPNYSEERPIKGILLKANTNTEDWASSLTKTLVGSRSPEHFRKASSHAPSFTAEKEININKSVSFNPKINQIETKDNSYNDDESTEDTEIERPEAEVETIVGNRDKRSVRLNDNEEEGDNKKVQTPPLGFANILGALDDDEVQKLIEEMKNKGLINNDPEKLDEDEKDVVLRKMSSRIKELENMIQSGEVAARMAPAGSGGEGTAGTCYIETMLEYDACMRPKKAETQMNYISYPKNYQPLDENYVANVESIALKLQNDETLGNLTDEEKNVIIQSLKDSLQQANPCVPANCCPEDSYTYQMETLCDFEVGDENNLKLLCSEVKVLPIPCENIQTQARIFAGKPNSKMTGENIPSESSAPPPDHPPQNAATSMTFEPQTSRGTSPTPLPEQNDRSTSPFSNLNVQARGIPTDMNTLPTTDTNTLLSEQIQRMSNTRVQIDLETLKAEIDQLRRALEMERQKSNTLEQSLNQLQEYTRTSQDNGVQKLDRILQSERGRLQEMTQELAKKQKQMENMNASIYNLSEELNIRIDGEAKVSQQLSQCLKELENTRAYLFNLEKQNAQMTAEIDQYKKNLESQRSENVTRVNNEKYIELYLRLKSYRKALAWQKKYLSIIIDGYKDVLCVSGVAFEHPYLLQKEVVLTPGAIGLCDRRCPKTRFRIAAKAIIAIVRMKFMVNRWSHKLAAAPIIPSSRRTSTSSIASKSGGSSQNVFSPPTRDSLKSQKLRKKLQQREYSAAADNLGNVRAKHLIGGGDESDDTEGYFIPKPSDVSQFEKSSLITKEKEETGKTVLSQYLERFDKLEKEIGQTIGMRASASHSNKNIGLPPRKPKPLKLD